MGMWHINKWLLSQGITPDIVGIRQHLTESMCNVTNSLSQEFRLKTILKLVLISLNWTSVNIASMCRFYCNETMNSAFELNPCTQ